MAQMVKKTTYNAPSKDILLNPDNAFRLGAIVSNTGVATNSDGRKVIPAGTPIGDATHKILMDRQAVYSVQNTAANGANAQGILFEDADVTDGNANVSIIIRGEVDLTKCPTIVNEAQAALTHIIFVKGA